MKPTLPRAAVVLACLAMLAACGHSRVVRRDYDAPSRPSSVRPDSRAAPQALPADGVHVVRRGETLYGISFRYGLRYQDVAVWNGIGDPYTIEIGQRLRLRPSGTVAAQSAVRPRPGAATPPVRSGAAAIVASTPTAGATTRPSAGPAGPVVSPRPPVVAAPATTTPVAAAGPIPAWHWPTRGQIIGRYVAGDRTQQGVNIAGSAGQPVMAAADGVVVYSGAGLVGYGELVIIKHSDEWLSAYAHNRKRLVAEGARVRAGETIAEMGRTGAIRDMLHFEIRRNGKPVDPLAWLPTE